MLSKRKQLIINLAVTTFFLVSGVAYANTGGETNKDKPEQGTTQGNMLKVMLLMMPTVAL